MSKRVVRAVALGFVVLLIGVGAIAVAGGDARNFRARPLMGYEEVPAVSTVARGSFTAHLSTDGTSLSYSLTFFNLEGTVTQSHIHFGQRSVAGGISMWLCETATNPSPNLSTPTCPAAPGGTVTGTLTAAEVIGPTGQGIAINEFGEIIAAMRSGVAYVNVHSSKIPGGEIRAQIKAVR